MTERRWFVTYGSPTSGKRGHSVAIVYSDATGEFPRGAAGGVDIKSKHEIPREYWGKTLDQIADFFERGVKPRFVVKARRGD